MAKTRRTLMPFLLRLAESGLSKGTIQNHVDNVWLPGDTIKYYIDFSARNN